MTELNTAAISIVALSKAILFIYVAVTIYLIWQRKSVLWHVIITTIAVTLFYVVLAWPLKTMWWGNTGDENLILASLTQVLHGNYFRDFYTGWLPPYYPPLYFWVTGTVARFFTMNAAQAAKVGVVLVLLSWFAAPQFLKMLFEKSTSEKNDGPLHQIWFWFLAPFIFLLMMDFDTLMTKPYEVLPALLVALFTGLCAQRLSDERWGIKQYLFFGIVGGILFMTFYFWLFFAFGALLVMALLSAQRKRSLFRVFMIGVILTVIASPYLFPLLIAYLRYGIENWQGHYLVPGDLVTVLPWDFSLRGLLALAGLVTLVIGSKQHTFLRSISALFILCYVFQFIGILQFNLGMVPLMPSKAFPFLADACLAIAAAFGACLLFQKHSHRLSVVTQTNIAIIIFLLFVSQMPFVRFIDSPAILDQLQKDLSQTIDRSLADAIISSVPDYSQHTWLVSDVPAVSKILPLSYFISFNQNYSHHSAQFTEHFDLIKRLAAAQTPDEFTTIIDQGAPRKIDALALYSSSANGDYLLFFWVDNYPNGGREQIVTLPRHLLESSSWNKKYSSANWSIFTRN